MKDSLIDLLPVLDDLLSDSVSAQLTAAAKQRAYDHGQLMQTRGDARSGLCIVRSGAVRVGNQGKDGSYLTTSILTAGQCYGEFTLLAGLPRTHEMVAIGRTVIDEIGKRKFLAIFNKEPQLAHALLKISLVRSHSLLEFMDDLRRLPLEVHVAKFILSSSTVEAEITIRQEDLAFSFGVSRVSMGKVLKRLEKLELVKLGYGKIQIVSPARLIDWLSEKSLILPVAPMLEM